MSVTAIAQMVSAGASLLGLVGTVLIGVVSWKLRAGLAELRADLKDWAYREFTRKEDAEHFDRRLLRLEDRPAVRAAKLN